VTIFFFTSLQISIADAQRKVLLRLTWTRIAAGVAWQSIEH